MDNCYSSFDKQHCDRITACIVFWGSNPVSYEFWIPAVFIALAGASLLIDFEASDPLDSSTLDPDPDHDDLSMMDEPLENIDDTALGDFPLVAANSPDAPSQTDPLA